MNHHAIAEAERLSDAHRQSRVAPRVALEIVLAEDIRRQQAPTPYVPVRRIARIPRVIEYRDSQRRPIDLPRIVQPLRLLAPRILLARLILRVDDLPGALGLRDVLGLILLQL